MLDKSSDPDVSLELLARSCRSGIVIVLEAPNHDDTFNLKKGYLTCDTETDETGKFLLRLLDRINLSPADVVLTNTVQCLPARKGERYPVTALQRRNCRSHLSRLFEITQPRVVIAFGNASLLALHRFAPVKIGGRVQSVAELKVSRLVAVPIAPWAGTVLFPLFHPGPIVRANALKRDGMPGSGRSAEQQLLDIQVLREILDGGATA
jgi:uracil-DNA glycosylase family 4